MIDFVTMAAAIDAHKLLHRIQWVSIPGYLQWTQACIDCIAEHRAFCFTRELQPTFREAILMVPRFLRKGDD